MTQDEILEELYSAEKGDLFTFQWYHRKDEKPYIAIFIELKTVGGRPYVFYCLDNIVTNTNNSPFSTYRAEYNPIPDAEDYVESFAQCQVFKCKRIKSMFESVDDDILI